MLLTAVPRSPLWWGEAHGRENLRPIQLWLGCARCKIGMNVHIVIHIVNLEVPRPFVAEEAYERHIASRSSGETKIKGLITVVLFSLYSTSANIMSRNKTRVFFPLGVQPFYSLNVFVFVMLVG
jgi:hypothetical protein